MPRIESTESHGKSSNEGTSARTRPFSFEEIMLRHKKKLAADFKGGTELRALSEKADVQDDSGQPDSDGDYKSTKISTDVEQRSSTKMEHKDKRNHDSEASTKVKSSDSSLSKSIKDKENKNEKLSYHKSSITDRLGANSNRELKKKGPKDAVEKDKHEEIDRKSRKEEKRKHSSRIDEKSRSEFNGSYSKEHDSYKLRGAEYSERHDKKKERSQPYNDGWRPKRRRSRSAEYGQERDRSLSVSPRAQKLSYHGRDYGDSSFQFYKDKSRRIYSDADKYRSGNRGYANGDYRQHENKPCGYLPKKRKTDTALKTPSPTIPSPERKSAKWDQLPAGTSNTCFGSMLANLQSPATKIHELVSSVFVIPVTSEPQPKASSMVLNASIDSFQLTQATRPMTTLYIENLPTSVSDKIVIDCFNDFFFPSDVNHIQGTKRCMSCIISKEKPQALVEFLTPEDATIALSFDGRSLSGAVLKITRPKDFGEAAIFIGGISKALSPDMFMEIASAFGILRACHFEFSEEFNESIAFLEYADHSITPKACTGLNGMKLAGHVLTAVQASPDDHRGEESTDAALSYIIPQNAKPLLADPTQVLQLKNVYNREEFSLLSESDLEEMLEDIRLECARFGTVKSLNIVRYDNICETTEAIEQNLGGGSCKMDSAVKTHSNDPKQDGSVPHPNDAKEVQNVDKEESTCDLQQNEPTDPFPVGAASICEDPPHLDDPSGHSPLGFGKDIGAKEETSTLTKDGDHQDRDFYMFEPGCALVEFSRPEAACTAAHCLHGRSYGERIVTVEYIRRELYLARFP